MSYNAARLDFGHLDTYRLGVETYDQDKLGLGPLMHQNAGATPEDHWVGPLPLAVARPMEQSTVIQSAFPWAMQWSNSTTSRLDWVFLAETTNAAATRKVVAYQYNRLTQAFTWLGYITVTFPTATNHTIRALRMTYDLHTAGTVAVSGTAVTGTSTTWLTDRACVGNRIGFGSTDPTQITTWYEISAIGSDTGITLSTSAGTISAGTAYVIEDLRAAIATTNATTTNGGLFVVKGLRIENFTSAGTAIPAATTVDNIRASYWLKSAATITETVAGSLGMQAATSKSSQMAWLASGTTTMRLFKFNIRAALTLTSGADTTAFQFSTAVSATLTGTAGQNNNGRIVSLGHGTGAGTDCFYFTTTTRVYRSKALSSIVAADATWLSAGDVMLEIPPGSANTLSTTSVMDSLEYVASLDKLAINTAPGGSTPAHRNYLTAYKTDSSPLDRIWGVDARQSNQTTADSTSPAQFSFMNSGQNTWSEGGLAYVCVRGSTASANVMLAIPLSADWEYAGTTNNRVITPRIATGQAFKYVQAWYQEDTLVGGTSGYNLGHVTEPARVYYRTTGISDNSGAWTLLDTTGLMTGVDGAAYIQFMLEFRTLGLTMIPARVNNIGVIYDADDSLPAELQWHLGDSSNTTGTIGFVQTATFSALNTLTITYYRSDTNAAVLVQASSGTTNGTFEYWTGSAWTAGLGSNAAGTRRRFVPSAGLPTGVDVYAKVVVA